MQFPDVCLFVCLFVGQVGVVCGFCSCSCNTCDELDRRLSASSENLRKAAVVSFPALRPPRSGGAAGKTVLHIYIHLCVCIYIGIYIGRYMHVCLYNIYMHSYCGLSLFSYDTRITESVLRAHLQAYSAQGCVHILNSILICSVSISAQAPLVHMFPIRFVVVRCT